MSHQGYSPYQHYVPPPQPQYAQQQFHGDRYQQQYTSHGHEHPIAGSHATGASHTTVSSLGTGNSQVPLNHHVSGPGSAYGTSSGGYGHVQPQHGMHHAAEPGGPGHRPSVRPGGEPVFEMSAEPARQAPERLRVEEDSGRKETTEQTSVQANPWPFYLDVSPTQTRKSSGEGADNEKEEQKKKQEEQEPVQAFPWPYHGPSTEEDEPRATVHPPKKETPPEENSAMGEGAKKTDEEKPIPPRKDDRLDKPLPPAGKDESVLDDILSDMDAQDEDAADEEVEEAQRPPKDPSLRPPPLNISRPQAGDGARPNMPSGAVSPGGRTYIPYRPGASPTASPTTQSPPQQQQAQHAPLVTAPHHVYMPQNQASLSPPPHPVASHSPNSTSPASGGGFSPYRPPSPQAPLSASSTGLGIHQAQHQGGLASPTLSGGDSSGFVPYQPSASPRPGRSPAQSHSGLASPTHPVSPSFPPPRQTPSPRPPASPRPGMSPRPSPGFDGAAVANTPYPPSPPRVSSPPGDKRTATAGDQSKPASPAPMAFYPPTTTQQAHHPTDPVPGRLASPPMGAALSRPSSRNDSGSVHSGVSSTMGGAPVHPQGPHTRPSPTPSSMGGGSQQSQYFSPQLGPQQQQPPQQSPLASPSYNLPQQTYASPNASSPHSAGSHYVPPQPPRPAISHSTTLPSPSPTPLSPPPPYTVIDLPPRPGSQPAAGSYHQESQGYHHQSPPPQTSQFPPQPTYAPSQGHQHHPHHHQQQQPQQQHGLPPLNLNQNLPPLPMNQNLPPLPPRPSTSHNGRPPPPSRPQGFGSALPNANNFPPPPKPNYNSNNGVPPPMPPRPPHHQNAYGSSHHNNKIFGSSSAKKWLDKTERLVEQTFGDILQPQVDQGHRPPAGPGGGGGGGGYHHGPPPQGGYGPPPQQPQYAAPPPGHQQQYPPQHRPLPQQGPYPEMGRGRGRR